MVNKQRIIVHKIQHGGEPYSLLWSLQEEYSRNVTIIFYSINISRTTVVKYKAYIEYYIYIYFFLLVYSICVKCRLLLHPQSSWTDEFNWSQSDTWQFCRDKNVPQSYNTMVKLHRRKPRNCIEQNTYMCDWAIIRFWRDSGCQAVPVKGSNVAVVSWWLAQISRKRAKRGM